MLVNQLLKLVSPYIEDFLNTLDIDDDPITCWEEYIKKEIPEKVNKSPKKINTSPKKINTSKCTKSKCSKQEASTKKEVKLSPKVSKKNSSPKTVKTTTKKAELVEKKKVITKKSPSKQEASSKASKQTISPKKLLNFDPTILAKSTVKDLKELCKENGHKQTGKKEELINRLLGLEENSIKTASKPKAKKDKRTEKQIIEQDSEKAVIKKVKKEVIEEISDISEGEDSRLSDASSSEESSENTVSASEISEGDISSEDESKAAFTTFKVRKNKFGNYENLKTGLVINNEDDQIIIGRQEDNGKISHLTKEDIEFCKLNKFQYSLPPTITSKQAEKTDKEDSSEELNSEDVGESYSEEEESSVEIDG